MSVTVIECGTHVEWEGKSGRVDLVVSSGAVPGVEGEVTGTADAPVARVIVGEEKMAVPVADLTVAEPEPEYKGEAAALVGLLAEHSRKAEGKGAAATLSPQSVQTAFERGLHEWPGADVTSLSADEWAVGRVAHLSKAALAPESVAETNDADLLDLTNPAYQAPPDGADAAAQPTVASPSPRPPVEDPTAGPPARRKPTQGSFDFSGQDPEDPEGRTPALPGDGQADPGGDDGPDGNPDAAADSTTVNADQLQQMLAGWDEAASEDQTGADET